MANFISDSDRHFGEFMGNRINANFIFAPLTTQTLLDIVYKMKPKNSSGLDNVSSKLLKQIIQAIVAPLCHIFNISLQTGYILIEFKTAKVVPVYKSGDKHLFTNYRPISLLSSFAKLLEKVVARQMVRFLHCQRILYAHQYGFRRGHNTSHPVLQFLSNIFDALNRDIPAYTLGIFLSTQTGALRIQGCF